MIAKRPLGHTGLLVSELGLGTWALGGLGAHADARNYGPVAARDAEEAFDAYVSAGGNFLDAAENYHDCEARLGRFLSARRDSDQLLVCSKVWQTDESTVRRKLDKSRQLLKRDVIDVYYLHNPPEETDEMHRALDLFQELKHEGKIRAIGATIKGHNVTDATVRLIEQYVSTGKLDVVMCIYSVLRQKNAATFEFAENSGVGIVLRTVLESGFLTGKYRADSFTASHAQDHRRRWTQDQLRRILSLVEEFRETAVGPQYPTTALAASRFALDTPHVSSVLIGAKNRQQVVDNLKALDCPPMPLSMRESLAQDFAGYEGTVSLGW